MRVKPLTSLIIEPTNTCNLRCSFCFVTEGMTRREGFMGLDLFKKVIDDCPDLEHLCMHNWGEPLLHKDIFKMFDYANEAGVKFIVMNTNGTLLTDKMISKLVNSPLNIIRFSIDGSSETFERIRGVALDKIEKNIIKLKNEKEKRRPELCMGVVFTVEEETQGDVDPFISHWKSIFYCGFLLNNSCQFYDRHCTNGDPHYPFPFSGFHRSFLNSVQELHHHCVHAR